MLPKDAIWTVIDDVADSVLRNPTPTEALNYAVNDVTEDDLQHMEPDLRAAYVFVREMERDGV